MKGEEAEGGRSMRKAVGAAEEEMEVQWSGHWRKEDLE